MNGAVFHERTKQALLRQQAHPAHAILLTGPTGAGKGYTAQYLASLLLKTAEPLRHPYVRHIVPIENSISIESVRELKQFLQLRVPGSSQIARLVIIEQADCLTTQAQNALLKILEEPPKDTVLILTVAEESALLPTVRSRCQRLHVTAPSERQLQAHFQRFGFSESALTKALLMSGGNIGLLHALLTEENGHPLITAIEHAKQLLAANRFERLIQVDSLSKQKTDLLVLLEAFERIATAALRTASQKGSAQHLRLWHRTLKNTLAAREALTHNASTKLVLTNFFLST